MKRTFIAIPVSPADDRLLTFIRQTHTVFSSSHIRWVDTSVMHLTLAFLGDTNEEDIPGIIHKLHQVASHHSPFFFSVSGAGFFGSPARPSVLWAGIKTGSGMIALQAEIAHQLKALGIASDDRAFSPHLTIGRIKDYKVAKENESFMKSYRGVELQETEVREFIYYESILTPGGPVYKSLGRFLLTAGQIPLPLITVNAV